MDIPKPRKRKGVLTIPQVDVWWVDAAKAYEDAGVTPEPMLTTGFPVKYDDNFVTVAGEWHASGGNRDFTTIPRGMVREIKVARWVRVPDWVMEWVRGEDKRNG